MGHNYLQFKNISFQYEAQSTYLIREFDRILYPGWTGVVGANGAGKSTLLLLATGELLPTVGQVLKPQSVLYCAQRTDLPPAEFEDFLYEKSAAKLVNDLEIEYDWLYRWKSLSHGERKRVQIGIALWKDPDLLALDEPTNHIDAYGRDLVVRSLVRYRGIGLLVSHDRELLNSLTTQNLFFEDGKTVLRPGNYAAGAGEAEREHQEAQRSYQKTQDEYAKLLKTAVQRRQEASRQQVRRSKRGLSLKDYDARFKKNLARLSGKDGTGGKLLRQMAGRLEQTKSSLEKARSSLGKTRKLGISLQTEKPSVRRIYHSCPGDLALGERALLRYPELLIQADARVALTGKNGCGKTTLLKKIIQELKNRTLLHVPQEVSLEESRLLRQRLDNYSKGALGHILSVVSRLGSDPEKILESTDPSPGEVRKLMIAEGLSLDPDLIILDEPTNHMDLPSISCLETALSNISCPLLLVSHDRAFLSRLTDSEWHITYKPGSDSDLILRI